MNVETIINGKRMALREPLPYIEVAIAPDIKDYWAPRDTYGPIRPITIKTERHRLTRLVAEYELDSRSGY